MDYTFIIHDFYVNFRGDNPDKCYAEIMDITIPYWAVWMMVTFGGGFVAWMVLLTKMAFENKSDARSSNEKDIVILAKINDVEKKIDENKNDLNTKLDKIEARIERLFGAEFAFMKQNFVVSQSGNKPV